MWSEVQTNFQIIKCAMEHHKGRYYKKKKKTGLHSDISRNGNDYQIMMEEQDKNLLERLQENLQQC